jgi:uncharacterized protein YjbI with pentapeptide repeats
MNLLPTAPGLQLEDTYIDAEEVSLTLASPLLPVSCPACGRKTSRPHSHYRRTQYPSVIPDLSKADLSATRFFFLRKDFSGANFSRTDLNQADFSGADLLDD